MPSRLLLQEWHPDRSTLGLVIFGFSVVSAASGLLLANSELGVLLNVPPSPNLPNLGWVYPLAQRVQAGSAFIGACAAAFAAAGGLGLFMRARWGGTMAASALAIEAVALLVNVIAVPAGVFVLGRVLNLIWLAALIMLVTDYRPRLPQRHSKTEVRSWMDEAFASDHDSSGG